MRSGAAAMHKAASPRLHSRFFRSLSPRRRYQALALLVLMILGAAAELVTLGSLLPYLKLLASPEEFFSSPTISRVAESVGWSSPSMMIMPATFGFLCVILIAGVIRIALTWFSNKYVYAVTHDLGVEVYRRTLLQPYSTHVSRNTSEIVAAMSKVQKAFGQVLMPATHAIVALVISTSILTALIIIDPVVAGAAGLGFGGIYLGISLLTRRTLRTNSVLIAQMHTRRIQAVQEGLGSIRDILLDGTQPVYLKNFSAMDRALRDAEATNNIIAGLPKYVLESLGTMLMVALAYAISLRDGGIANALPVLGVLVLGAQRLLPLMQHIYHGWAKISGNHRVLADVLDLTEQPIAMDLQQASQAGAVPFRKGIELRNVAFSYQPDAKQVLSAINLVIPRGARVGFVGSTGSGKSTLIDLIMGLLEPTAGHVYIDGQPLQASNRRKWQSHIAHVPQSIFLADATVAENIALGRELHDIDQEQLEFVSELAQARRFILQQSDGFRAIVGERGVRLSGGQRQRLGIARALYKRADVLVLDEATSALDDATEGAVMAGLSKLSSDMTILMIAHRVSTLSDCDFVVRLDSGRIVEVGPPAQVLGKETARPTEPSQSQEKRA